MVQVCLVGYAVGGAFLGLAYFDLYYHLIAVLVILGAIVAEAEKRDPATSEVTAEREREASSPPGRAVSTASLREENP